MPVSGTGSDEPGRLMQPVIEISRRAAAAILSIYDSDFDIDRKGDDSPLTAADMAAHRLICAELKALTPDVPILSEESADIPYATRKGWETYWLVDPLDGTKEFVKRNGEFTVNIALVSSHRPVLGVVYVPVTGTAYYAGSGGGAWRITAGGDPVRLQTRHAVSGKLVVAGSRSHAGAEQRRFFEALGPGAETLSIGSSLKFCLVAEGRVDAYPRFGPTSEWDTAAAHCVVEEAGGRVSRMDLEPLLYNTKDSLLNPPFLVVGDSGYDWRGYLVKAQAGLGTGGGRT